MGIDEARRRLREVLGEPCREAGEDRWRCRLGEREALVRLVGNGAAAVFIEPTGDLTRARGPCALRFARLDSTAWLEFVLSMLRRAEPAGAGSGR
jgi:hypothetical protein